VINFTRAFESAWERMVIILFRPFALGKWFVIGFSAFLAGLLAGGNGVSGSFNTNSFNPSSYKPGQVNVSVNSSASGTAALQQLNAQFAHFFSGMTAALIIGLVVAFIAFVLIFTILILWLGARGQFMFLDNIVRNRGEVAWPWQHYARLANNFFLYYLGLTFALLLLVLPILVAAIVLSIPLFQQQRWPNSGEVSLFVALFVLYLIIAIVGNVVLFIVREFSLPIMFRQGILARPAFGATIDLLRRFPGSIGVFLLLRLALFIGTAIICAIACCATCCCLYQIPYLGTVIILPALVFIRCFTLDCLAQFGPEFDVFTVDVPPTTPPNAIPPLTPPPPLG
jgi:hypothetical protein